MFLYMTAQTELDAKPTSDTQTPIQIQWCVNTKYAKRDVIASNANDLSYLRHNLGMS